MISNHLPINASDLPQMHFSIDFKPYFGNLVGKARIKFFSKTTLYGLLGRRLKRLSGSKSWILCDTTS